ncbi:hypothetical protein ACHAXT_009428 [Thalassiosira profunda]
MTAMGESSQQQSGESFDEMATKTMSPPADYEWSTPVPTSPRMLEHLFLLNHALECEKVGDCKHPFCSEVKVLAQHARSCKDAYCNVRHCGRSKLMLYHFNTCTFKDCAICTPVHEALFNENHEGTRKRLDFKDELPARKLSF